MRELEKIIIKREVLYTFLDGEDDTLELILNKMLPKANSRQDGVMVDFKEIKDEDESIFSISYTEDGGTFSYLYRDGDYIVLDYSSVDEYGIPIPKDEIIYLLKGYKSENFHKYYLS